MPTNEIQELNLSFLLLAQCLLKGDRETAMVQMNLDVETADIIASLTASQIAKLSQMPQLIVRPNFESAEQLKSIVNPNDKRGMEQLHASILLNSQSPTSNS